MNYGRAEVALPNGGGETAATLGLYKGNARTKQEKKNGNLCLYKGNPGARACETASAAAATLGLYKGNGRTKKRSKN